MEFAQPRGNRRERGTPADRSLRSRTYFVDRAKPSGGLFERGGGDSFREERGLDRPFRVDGHNPNECDQREFPLFSGKWNAHVDAEGYVCKRFGFQMHKVSDIMPPFLRAKGEMTLC